MFYAAIFHFFAGAVTGSVFKVRTLLLLLLFVMAEAAMLGLIQGSIAGLWALVNLVGLQAGYLAGIYCRSVFEDAGYSLPNRRPRRLP